MPKAPRFISKQASDLRMRFYVRGLFVLIESVAQVALVQGFQKLCHLTSAQRPKEGVVDFGVIFLDTAQHPEVSVPFQGFSDGNP
jgi:hypothetical protein